LAINLILLLIGIVILVVAGDYLVRGAAAFARKWGVSALIVGLTIVAFGTSAPELVVSIQAVMAGFDTSALALGNVVGSNITNILMVLGFPALIMAIPTDTPGVTRNTVFATFVTVLLIGLLFITGTGNGMARWQGGILFAGIIIYLIWMFQLARSGSKDPALREMAEVDEMDGLPRTAWVSAIFIIAGSIGLAVGGSLIVDNASDIAKYFDISETIIGLTLVAIGTSLPELATVVVAAYRGHTEVAIGNVVGSNIFNILAVLGAASLVGPIKISEGILSIDVWVMLAAIITLLVLIIAGKPIGRKIGAFLSIAYIAYIGLLAYRMMTEASVPL